MIYLDNAATTYPKSESVYQALDYANREYAFNAVLMKKLVLLLK